MIGIICWVMAGFSSYAAYSFYSVRNADVSSQLLTLYQVWFYVFVVTAIGLFVMGLVSFLRKVNNGAGGYGDSSDSDEGLFSFMNFDSGGSCDSGSDSGGGDCGGGGD